MSDADSYSQGYQSGYANAQRSAHVVGIMYIPTAEERAQSINFHGNAERRRGWLAGWTKVIRPYREWQTRELGVTTAQEWINRYRHP